MMSDLRCQSWKQRGREEAVRSASEQSKPSVWAQHLLATGECRDSSATAML